MRVVKFFVGAVLAALLTACNSTDIGLGGTTTPAGTQNAALPQPAGLGSQNLVFPNVSPTVPAVPAVTSAPNQVVPAAPNQIVPAAQNQVAPPTQNQVAPPAQSTAAGAVRMRFAPMIGAPVGNVTPLSRRLSERGKEQAITLVASSDLTATHVLKGYFSILQEGTGNTVIYVFDVLDPSGNRLHRIQGQETVAGVAGADPWASVPPATMETIADKTMADFKQWLAVAK